MRLILFGKSVKTDDRNPNNLFKAFGRQLSMFADGGSSGPGMNREGETKEGKGGTLQLKRDASGKGAHWHLLNKKQSEGRTPKENTEPEPAQIGIKPITASKAYNILSDKLGHKAVVRDKQGNVLDEGKFLLVNEKNDNSLSLLIKNSKGESDFINVPFNQNVIKKGDEIEFRFSEKNIAISLKEIAPFENDEIGGENDEEIDIAAMESKAKKMEEWNKLADQYIKDANSQKDVYLQDLDTVSRELGLRPISHRYREFAVKSKDSIINKFERNESEGKVQKNQELTDVLRGTIIIKSPGQYSAIMQSLNDKGYKLWNDDYTNLYDDETPGYKHIAVKLTKGDEDRVVKELLLMTPRMYEAKFGFGHDVYDVQKNIKIGLSKMDKNSSAYKRTLRFADTMTQLVNDFYKKAYLSDMEDAKSFSTSAVAPSIQLKTKARKESSVQYSKPPKRLIRELRSSLKAFWQPLLASSLSAATGMPSFSDSSSSTLSNIASIANPTINVLNKFASNILNLKKSSKRKVNRRKQFYVFGKGLEL